MRRSRVALAAAALLFGLAGCSTHTTAEDVDSSEPIAAAEARDQDSGPATAPRCDGFLNCAATVFTDFVYLPVRIARGMTGDVRVVTEEHDAPAE